YITCLEFAYPKIFILRAIARIEVELIPERLRETDVVTKLQEQVVQNENVKAGTSLLDFVSLIERKKDVPRTDLSKCLERIVDEAVSLTGAERASIMLIDEEKEEFSIGAARGLTQNIMDVRIKAGEGIAGWVFKEDAPLLVKDISKDGRFRSSARINRYKNNSFLSVPLTTTKSMGVINVANKINGECFNEEDLKVLLLWTGQAAEMIEQARLYEGYARLKGEAEELEKLTRKLATSKTIISQVNELLDESIHELTLINEVNKAVNNSLNCKHIINSIVDIVRDVIDYHVLAVLLVEEDKTTLYLDCLTSGENDWITEDEIRSRMIGAFTSQTGISIEQGQINILGVRNTEATCQKNKLGGPSRPGGARLTSFISIPIISSDRIMGMLGVGSRTIDAFSKEDSKNLNIVATHSAPIIENAFLHKKVENLSVTDELTNLYNYRHFKERLKEELVRVKRYQTAFSLIMLDIDDFKKVNDLYGHPQGDIVLKELAGIIKGITRGVNIVSRYGGEEFVIILPEENKIGASVLAERLRKRVEEAKFSRVKENSDSIRVTISLGISTYPADGNSEIDLVQKADDALYMAKKRGKNMVCWAPNGRIG
ncbi:MAG: sensor domain-containing diguanylate cyclase, partial [bacterium]|nr:sensor domain-containing diguanylate cyclase [bacterium]